MSGPGGGGGHAKPIRSRDEKSLKRAQTERRVRKQAKEGKAGKARERKRRKGKGKRAAREKRAREQSLAERQRQRLHGAPLRLRLRTGFCGRPTARGPLEIE